MKEAIKRRTDNMLRNGLIEEVDSLVSKFNLNSLTQSMRAIGYRETLQYLNKEITLDELHSSITISTQQLAKRQITWMKKFNIDYKYSYPENNYHSLFGYIKKILN